MFDNVINGMKNTNKIGHITLDFRQENLVKISWVYNDLLLLNLIEEEFDSGYTTHEIPEYFEFNNKKYNSFNEGLIEDILNNPHNKCAVFVCTKEI
jgi:hypothetical protein